MNASASADSTPAPAVSRRHFAVHGPAVEVECAVPGVEAEITRLLGPFAVPGLPEGFNPVHGTIRPYDQAEVVRRLSPTARPLPRTQDLAELFEEGERFWLVDDRWGMVEINFLKGQWRSWVLPRPQFDAVRVAEMAVFWPLAQLLRPRGLYLLPAAAAVRDGFAFLVLCPFGLEPELTSLARSGYKIIGQRWTALREEEGRLALLHLPGRVERGPTPRLWNGAAAAADDGWVDLNGQFLGAWQNHAFCDAVFVAEAGRRPHASMKETDPSAALAVLRRAWPIAELHPSRRNSPLPLKLSQLCRCAELQLSRNAGELLPLLDAFRDRTAGIAA